MVVAAFAVETATGFGALIVALGVGTFIVPLAALLPVLVLLDTILCGYLAGRHRATIDLRWLVQRVVPWMTVGLALGLVVALRAPEALLRRLLGMLVLIVVARDLWTLTRAPALCAPLSSPLRRLALLGAGVMHGILATGGPLLVYVLGRSELDKSAFRSTLAAIWVPLDLLLVASYAATGRITTATLGTTLALLPGLLLAIALGEWVHRRLDERRFRTVVMAVLLGVSLTLVAQ